METNSAIAGQPTITQKARITILPSLQEIEFQGTIACLQGQASFYLDQPHHIW